MDTSPIRKNKSGSIIPVEERKVIYNVFKYFKLSDFNMTVESIVIKTASACGVSENTVYKIIKEKKVTKTLKSPVKKRVRPSTVDKLDELDKCAIRAKVHSLYLNNDYPTLDKIMTLCEADEDISTFKRTTLHKILPEIGFDFNKRNNRSLLVEREDIVLWRRKYLRQITKYRKENKTIYFLDETWVNTGHVKTKAGTDSNTDNSRHTSQKSLSTRARAPTGKGKSLIILHIGSDKGFVQDGLLVLESKSTKDNEEMDGERFLKWFKNIIPRLEPGSVVVMDNAPYHSVKEEKIPTTAWNRQQIIDWLQSKGIFLDTSYLKKELLYEVDTVAPQYNKCLVDETAKDRDIKILRLPPYHCKLNPIKLVWAQIKNYIGVNNSTFEISDVKKLLYDAITLIDANRWKECCDHTILEENIMWNLDDVMELAEQNSFAINTNADSIFTTNILRNLTRMVQKGPRPLVLCGPSGSGKSTLLKRLLKEFPDKFGFSVSHTTRAPRPGEKGGVHYHFTNIDDMTKAVKRGEFIETATFSGNLYGTSKQAVDDVRRTGKICVLDIDIEGVKQVTTTDLNPLLVFVMPPSIEELERRLRARNTEQEDAVQKRLDTAKKEITFGQEPGNFHIIILNDNLNKAYSELREFISKNVEDKEQALRGL
ncbi:unnamed protein product [Arctia plantaginis]|uniref:guanylate kinase n=1 Tax=Arctia plantaginis TaxID=874455 RepID=A0A8S1A6D7_ARCPL|nr:unnamed protein product [Arctia plantaginis]